MTQTYQEPIGRWVVEQHEELPEEHKEAYRSDGIDPDDLWTLKWSFNTEADAQAELQDEMTDYEEFCKSKGYRKVITLRVRDRGADAHTHIERVAW